MYPSLIVFQAFGFLLLAFAPTLLHSVMSIFASVRPSRYFFSSSDQLTIPLDFAAMLARVKRK